MKQIVLIHGGDSYSSYDKYISELKSKIIYYDRLRPTKKWQDAIVDQIQDADILTPTMPNSANANYSEWKIMFEKIIPFFQEDVRLVGHSLGAMFLAKHLNKHRLPNKISQLHLIAGGYGDKGQDYGSFAVTSARHLDESSDEIYIYHSEDDPVVPFSEFAGYRADLPNATSLSFTDRGHFLDYNFPESINYLEQ